MNELTIEQLKSLEVGDWVWLIDNNSGNGTYAQLYCVGRDMLQFDTALYKLPPHLYSDYGTKWVAYKNKEMAEGKCVELPCLRDIEDFIENNGNRVRMKELNYMEKGRIYSIPYVAGQFEEAERRLAELTKE